MTGASRTAVQRNVAWMEASDLIREVTGQSYFLHADRQGLVIAVTNHATGQLVARYIYDAFGQREQTVDTIAQDRGFTGREFDEETGLYYYRARYYDPALGRFLQSDPLGFAAGDLNLYAYTWNDPANWTDPSGLTADKSPLFAGVTAMAQNAVRVGVQAMCVANRVGSALRAIAAIVEDGDLETFSIELISTSVSCRTRARAPGCGCGSRGGGAAGAMLFLTSLFSFPEGTLVQTPDGRVAIEDLREGDMVIARDEETGVSGIFPITAVMSRSAPSVLQFTLEDVSGQVSVLGATAEHPFFAEGLGWTAAGELAPGDQIRGADLGLITVLSITLDNTPQRVYNMEVAGAHTYFAGELDVWAHNAGRPRASWWRNLLNDPKQPSHLRGCLLQQQNRGIPPSRWRLPPGYDIGHHPTNRGAHNDTSRPEFSSCNRRRPGITLRNILWR